MSTEMQPTGRFSLTRFWGGQERQLCLQITPPTVGPNPSRDEGFITVTRQEAAELAESLMRFANGTLEELYD